MSAKWRAIQHRHRYTYSAVIFPDHYIESLNQIEVFAPKLCRELKELVSLTSTYSQVNHVKNVASSFSEALSSLANGGEEEEEDEEDGGVASLVVRAYLEIIFFENSLPLHRTLVSALGKSKKKGQNLICGCFKELCGKYGNGREKRFCVSRAVLSVMGLQKLGFLMGVVEDCAVLVAKDVVDGLCGVVDVNLRDKWARPSPIVMEQCQESLSCLYYLLQRCVSKFRDLGSKDHIETIFRVILSILKLPSFSRDCFVAAGVCFCAALQVCLDPEELGIFIVEGIFFKRVVSSGVRSVSNASDIFFKVPYSGDLCSEIQSVSLLSRLCLIRGILTAVDRCVLNMHFVVERENPDGKEDVDCKADGSTWTILCDGILLELCNYCENPIDSHFNFHALTVLQICMQQIKTSLLNKLGMSLENHGPIQEESGTRILRIVWNNLEDPLSQTVKQVQLVFELFLDIQSTLQWDDSEKIKSFLAKIALDLLHMGPRCKGRYVPLATLTKRLGAKAMLDMNRALISETVQAYIDDDVCCAATSFLKCFLENLRDNCWKIDGIAMGYVLYRKHCLPPFLYGLASGISKLRSNLNTYALPVLLEIDVDSIFPMLAYISVVPSMEDHEQLPPELNDMSVAVNTKQKVAILISLLKVCRILAFIEGDINLFKDPVGTQNDSAWVKATRTSPYAFICVKGIYMKIQVEWLMLALTDKDESLRVDAAELLLLNPKTASLPSHLELALMKEAIPLNMRCASTAFQMKWSSLFRKFFSRVRTALERQLKLKSWQPVVSLDNNGSEDALVSGSEDDLVSRANDLFSFMKWLSIFLFFSCYPSAPYKRKIMAMQLILIMVDVWPTTLSSQDNDGQTAADVTCLHPYSPGITSPSMTYLLVGSVIDSWDRLRESSFRILLHFPTPLPGFSSEVMIVKVLKWARKLVCSPRVRESDAGALSMRLLFRKYVLELGWSVKVSENIASQPQSLQDNGDSVVHEVSHPVTTYIKSLIDWLDAVVQEGERDLSEACQKSFVHGVLLTLRYTFEELDWKSNAVLSCISHMRLALKKLLELILQITSLALWVVSADAWSLPEDVDEMVDDDSFLLECPVEMDNVESPSESDKNSRKGLDARSSEQAVMVGCWLAMKEVSLLLGTIIRKIPLPTTTCSSPLHPNGAISDISYLPVMAESKAILDFNQLESMGNHFLEVLLKMKHNGAIDKTRAGFTALCNRLLCSNDPRLCELTESWMEKLMERTVAKGQVVDDLLRRSAGIPAAFIALFLAEPEGAPKKLLPRALRWLIDIAKCPLEDFNSSDLPNGIELDHGPNADEKKSKIRDEGVIPIVHAFNVLRMAFNDTNLAADTSGFSAEAMIVSIRAFSSSYWEVRNSACLAYTALVRRMIGFLNVQKRESARRALTGLEFFHRYPSVHGFFLDELKVATASLEDGSTENSESSLANVVHPSLCPMLILLSRLKPSALASEIGDNLDPFLFMPFIRSCSTQRNMKIRILAARALTGLVSNEKLQVVLIDIALELSCFTKEKRKASFNLIHGLLLQICNLLDVNCKNLSDPIKKEQILRDLIKVLLECSWIGRPRLCPCPVLNTSFLRVLDNMLCIAWGCRSQADFIAIRNLVMQLASDCLDLEHSYVLPFYDPTHSELLQQSATSYFRCFFYPSKEVSHDNFSMLESRSSSNANLLEPELGNDSVGLQEKLMCCFSSASYEVRLASLKWLLKFLKMIELDGDGKNGFSTIGSLSFQKWANTNLQDTLLRLLASEKNHRCLYYILRIFNAWNLQRINGGGVEKCKDIEFVGVMNCSSLFQLWEWLLLLYNSVRHVKTQETLICCMGISMRRFTDFFTSSLLEGTEKIADAGNSGVQGRIYECFIFFHKLIKRCSSPSDPVNMRSAAVESIVASGLLEQAELIGPSVLNGVIPTDSSSVFDPEEAIIKYARLVLSTWFICIRLLEDEDDGIRQRLASSVQKCFARKKMHDEGFFPTQVDKLIVSSFEYLSSIFGHWIEYFNCLSECVYSMAKPQKSSSGGDLVRRVFDKEIDNHHEEKLLICQICCCHLEKLPSSSSWAIDSKHEDPVVKFLYDWRMRFCEQLLSFAADHVLTEDDVDWIGGIGNHKDAFLPLYANLLGFHTLSKSLLHKEAHHTHDRARLLGDVVDIRKSISPFLQNPLILNLYYLVLDLHEGKLGTTADISAFRRTNPSLWDGFDPYFLLR